MSEKAVLSDIEKDEKQKKMAALAEEILTNARNTLLVSLRFLDVALSQFIRAPVSEGTICTNGQYLFYDPLFILRAFQEEPAVTTRNYLHIVLHCIFRHMYNAENMQKELWDLACDIAVEATISELNLKNTVSGRVKYQRETLDALQNAIGKLTAEKVYRYFRDNPLSEEERQKLPPVFKGDDHALWYQGEKAVNAMLARSGRQKEKPGLVKSTGGVVSSNRLQRAEEKSQSDKWKEIAENMQMELKTFSRQHADAAGGLIQNLEEVGRETYDYKDFLKKFAVRREFMRINDDEFDYIYYTYGLKLYKNVPLIEPLEYKEEKRIRDFVIAIDTSGSVSGELVQTFVQKTWNILKSTESFFSKMNLHIIQCDSKIQEHVKITDQKSFDRYIENMEIKGLGGTDFRPVFALVNKLRRDKEFTDLKGLIYFTDGEGIFPPRKPDYDTACVFIDSDSNNPRVPPWVIRLILKREDIESLPEI